MERRLFLFAAAVLAASLSVSGAAAPRAAFAAAPPHQAGRPAMKERPSGDRAIVRTVADAMGFVRGIPPAEVTNTINRVQMRGMGTVTVDGVRQKASRYVYTLSLSLKGAREDIIFEGKTAPARSVKVVLDKDAWDEREPGVDGKAAAESALSRRLQLARTPYGYTRALLDADAASVKITDGGPKGKVTIVFPIEGVTTTCVLDADYRPETISMTVDGKAVVTRYAAYRDLSEYGVMFPTRWTETVDGKPRHDLTINDGRIASYAVFPKPAALTAGR